MSDEGMYFWRRLPRRTYVSSRFGGRPLRYVSRVFQTPGQSELVIGSPPASGGAYDGGFTCDEPIELHHDTHVVRIQYRLKVKESDRCIEELVITKADKNRDNELVQVSLNKSAVEKLRKLIGAVAELDFPASGQRERLDDEILDEEELARDLRSSKGKSIARRQLEAGGPDELRQLLASMPRQAIAALLPLIMLETFQRELRENTSVVEQFVEHLVAGNIQLADVAELARRRQGLSEFREHLGQRLEERAWQIFFEKHRWIFGVGLELRLLVGGEGLEVTVPGLPTNTSRRTDALLRTEASSHNLVVVEIKRPDSLLVDVEHYRRGLYTPSADLSGGVAQLAHTAQLLEADRQEDIPLDTGDGTRLRVRHHRPRLYLLIGDLHGFAENRDNNDDKRASFERYRAGLKDVEVITYDELYARAQRLVEAMEQRMGAGST